MGATMAAGTPLPPSPQQYSNPALHASLHTHGTARTSDPVNAHTVPLGGTSAAQQSLQYSLYGNMPLESRIGMLTSARTDPSQTAYGTVQQFQADVGNPLLNASFQRTGGLPPTAQQPPQHGALPRVPPSPYLQAPPVPPLLLWST